MPAASIMDGKYDGVFLGIAREHDQGIDQLLGTFFSFLRRKTDFFARPEQAEEAVLKCLRQQSELHQKSTGATKKAPKKKKKKEPKKQPKGPSAYELQQKKLAEAKAKASAAKICEVDENGNDILPDCDDSAAPPKAPSAMDVDAVEAKEEEESKGQKPNIGNGGDGPGYTWTQTLKEVNIVVPVEEGIRGKHLTVNVTASKITVGKKGQTPIIKGDLWKACRPDDLVWTIDDVPGGREVTITLEKKNNMEWWRAVIQGDESLEIDTQKVQPENSQLGDLDADTRQTVEKMMYDQRQKALGKPTSEEQSKQDIINKFMKQHPEMDFSNAKIS